MEILSAPYLGLLDLGASLTTKNATEDDDMSCMKLTKKGCLALYPDDWWQVDFPGKSSYLVEGFTIKRRKSFEGE